MTTTLIVTVISSWYLVGLSVTIALVVYPSFDLVDDASWPAFHRQHVARITWAVGPAWAAQALGLAWWLLRDPHLVTTSWWLSSLGAAASVVFTVGWAIRFHECLHTAYDPQLGRRLRRVHWWRTVSWLVAAVAATTALSSN